MTMNCNKIYGPCAQVLILLVGLVILTIRAASGDELRVLQGESFQIYFAPALKPASVDLARVYGPVRKELERELGWHLNRGASILLIKDRTRFQSMAESPLTVAFAVPDKGLIVIDHSRMNVGPFTMELTLKHELCHLLLHEHIRAHSLPRWLDEGVCQWLSGGLPDIVIEQKRSLLNRATLSGSYIPLRALTKGFPGERNALSLSYEQSKSFVVFLAKRYGNEKMLEMLNGLKRGREVNETFLEVFSTPLEDLEAAWHRSLKSRTTWIVTLSYYVYEIVFALLAMITIYAFVRMVIRKRAYRDEDWDEGE